MHPACCAKRLLFVCLPLLLLLANTPAADAGWFDDMVDTAKNAFNTTKTWVTETAAPTVKEKFGSAQDWVSNKAAPAVDSFMSDHAPEVKRFWNEDARPAIEGTGEKIGKKWNELANGGETDEIEIKADK